MNINTKAPKPHPSVNHRGDFGEDVAVEVAGIEPAHGDLQGGQPKA
jgi:hypothetical protein